MSETREQEFEETLMYGHYTGLLAKLGREESEKIYARRRDKELQNKLEYETRKKSKSKSWLKSLINFLERWFLLSILGIVMGIIGFVVDESILMCRQAHLWFFEEMSYHPALQYFAWTLFPIIYVVFSAGILKVLVPQAAGAGIPEMKTIIRGTTIKDFLTFKGFVAKTLSIMASMGSGIPLGREGSLVHMSGNVATWLNSIMKNKRGIYENECRWQEMLGAACSVGVATCFASPIGGVLFSIEVTTEYFAVRNYWYAFFASMWGALLFRLMSVWLKRERTLTALFRISFELEVPYDPIELLAFAFLGIILGLAGALFVFLCNFIVHVNRRFKTVHFFLQQHWPIYPAFVTLIITSVTFPLGFGQFLVSELTAAQWFTVFFNNNSWINLTHPVINDKIISFSSSWTKQQNIYVFLTVFILMRFWMAALVSSVPIANGVFLPCMVIGGAFGRLFGELLASRCPDGFGFGSRRFKIQPGSYAIAGAAAMGGSVTHTVSAAVIICEITGQIFLIIPVTISVLISTAVCACLQPSFYDMVIRNKKLPYLPPLTTHDSRSMYEYTAKDFMITDVKYITHDATYGEVKQVLEESPHIRSFPLVENSNSKILIGSILQVELWYMINNHLRLDHILSSIKTLEKDSETISLNSFISKSACTTPVNKRQFFKGERLSFGDGFGRLVKRPNHNSLSFLKSSFSSLTKRETEDPKNLSPVIRKKLKSSNSLSNMIRNVHSENDMKKFWKQKSDSSLNVFTSEIMQWKEEKLNTTFNFDECKFDEAPFQLVEKTTLHKVQCLFSMLSLTHAYVTSLGKLIGVITLKELRHILENPESLTKKENDPSIPSILVDKSHLSVDHQPSADSSPCISIHFDRSKQNSLPSSSTSYLV